MGNNCWECKYLVDWDRVNFIQDFKCGWFKVHKGEQPKPLLPKMDPDKGCKYFELRKPGTPNSA